MATAHEAQARTFTIHGPHGLSATRLLVDHAIRLSRDDILLIAEHDDAAECWLETEPAPSPAGRQDDPAR